MSTPSSNGRRYLPAASLLRRCSPRRLLLPRLAALAVPATCGIFRGAAPFLPGCWLFLLLNPIRVLNRIRQALPDKFVIVRRTNHASMSHRPAATR